MAVTLQSICGSIFLTTSIKELKVRATVKPTHRCKNKKSARAGALQISIFFLGRYDLPSMGEKKGLQSVPVHLETVSFSFRKTVIRTGNLGVTIAVCMS